MKDGKLTVSQILQKVRKDHAVSEWKLIIGCLLLNGWLRRVMVAHKDPKDQTWL